MPSSRVLLFNIEYFKIILFFHLGTLTGLVREKSMFLHGHALSPVEQNLGSRPMLN